MLFVIAAKLIFDRYYRSAINVVLFQTTFKASLTLAIWKCFPIFE